MTTATFEGEVRGVRDGITRVEHCDAFLTLTGSISSLRHSLQLFFQVDDLGSSVTR